MKNYGYVFAVLFLTTSLNAWWGGSEYRPAYQGGGNAGNITPSRFAPRAYYNRNTGWGSPDNTSCNDDVVIIERHTNTQTVSRPIKGRKVIYEKN